MPKRQLPWFRIFAEGAVIVFSILLAFGIEAWWSGQLEQEEEQQALEGLESDFAATLEELKETIRYHESTLDRLVRLEDMAESELASVPPDSVQGFVFALQAGWTFDGQLGTLEGLIASGRLSLLRDERVRSSLLAWKANVDDLGEEAAVVYAGNEETVRRVAELGGPWPESSLASTPLIRDVLSHFSPPDFTVVATDAELRTLLRIKRQQSIIYLNELIPLVVETESVILMLSAASSQ